MLCIESVYVPMLVYTLYSAYTICTLLHYLLCIHIILYKLYAYMICNSVYFVLYVTYCTLCIYFSLNLIYIKSTYVFCVHTNLFFFDMFLINIVVEQRLIITILILFLIYQFIKDSY